MKNRLTMLGVFGVLLTVAALSIRSSAQAPPQGNSIERALAEPFKGVTTDGSVVSGLFSIESTGVSTEPIREAAETFLAGLTPEQHEATTFPLDDVEWRRWHNIHRAERLGVSFQEMTEQQRDLAFAMMRASLSARGLKQTQDVMKLNGTIAEMTERWEEYGEWRYWITVMGTPSATEPWGWQLDGHHLVINYFVLGDQVVMTPTFMGSEPVIAESGKFAGTAVLQDEQNKGYALLTALNAEQQKKAIIEPGPKTGNNSLAQAYRDNLVLDYAGLKASEMTAGQKQMLLDAIGLYVGTMREGHAKIRMEEVRRHLDDTYFAWIGETEPDSVFYYRIHSPVVLIEFDHQNPVALPGPRVPGRIHVHSVIRTPNGNDYGKDLLRQHYTRSHNLNSPSNAD